VMYVLSCDVFLSLLLPAETFSDFHGNWFVGNNAAFMKSHSLSGTGVMTFKKYFRL
jgi:hypothetical protein